MKLAQQKSKRTALVKYALAMPLFAGMLIFASACRENVESESVDAVNNSSQNRLQTTTEIFTSVEDNPEFPGGTAAMFEFINSNMKYPVEAQQKNLEGRVFVKFVVQKDGTIGQKDILKGIGGGGTEEEVIRILESMPKWKPGYQDGKPVDVWFTMPFFFQLE